MISGLFKGIGTLILLAILAPILYLVIRMNQPLSQPEFKGDSFIEVQTEWRRNEQNSIGQYMASHPEFEYDGIGTPLAVCYSVRLAVTLLVGLPQSFGYTFAAWAGAVPDALHPLPIGVTGLNFLNKWWQTFEFLFWYNRLLPGDARPVYCAPG